MAEEETKTPQEQPAPVPYERFKEVLNKARTLEEREAALKDALTTKQQEYEAALQTKEQEWQKALEEREAALKDALTKQQEMELRAVRYEIAMQTGLPAAMVDRLRGTTPEEIAADAEQLKGIIAPFTPGAPPAPSAHPANSITAEKMSDPEWVRNNIKQVWKAIQNNEL